MTDVFDKEKRSKIMSSIKSKDTKPELIVRRLLHSMGYRYRLHRKDLPGSPDIVLSNYKKVIFIHGCFWHGHKGCSRAKLPKTNTEKWQQKISKNMKRDMESIEKLHSLGWAVLVLWTCEIKDEENLKRELEDFILQEW
ncbi:MAG: DNA mismatch endonuclease Vsr [Bacteroidales bacterium]|nr:DNA mismatch endonuclease Vsr [Bacteroidales bacterium]